MNQDSNESKLIKTSGAWIPPAISLPALAFLIVYVAVVGIHANAQGDERTPANIFQCLMLVQIPVIAFFVLKWLPKRPKQALVILALQVAAWIFPIASVLWLESL